MSRAFGSVRQSQVITTYGPGALIDLPTQQLAGAHSHETEVPVV